MDGNVLDAAGQALAGVVIVLSPEAAPALVRIRSTQPDGRYTFEDLSAGVYRLMAVKAGYVTAISRIDTAIAGTLDFVLRPRAARDPDLADDMDWVLRLGSRDVLRSITSVDEPAGGADQPAATEAARAALSLPVAGEVQQWFSGGSPIDVDRSAARGPSDSSGSQTSLQLAMRLNQAIDLRVAGDVRREDLRFGASLPDTGSAVDSGRNASADRFGLTLGVITSPASNLRFEALYDRDSLDPQGVARDSGGLAGSRSVTRSWLGSWHGMVGDASSVDVTASYMDAEEGELNPGSIAADPIMNRLWRAGGRFSTEFGGAHQIKIGFGARMLELDGPEGQRLASTGSLTPVALAGPGAAGLAMHLTGTEAWSLTPAFTLDLGLDYHRAMTTEDLQYMIPQAGITWAPFRTTKIKTAISYVTDMHGEGLDPASRVQAESSASERVGYLVSIQQRLGDRTSLALTGNYRPASFESSGPGTGFPGAPIGGSSVLGVRTQPIYITEGEAESRELALTIEQRMNGFTARIEALSGRLDGRYAATVPGEALWTLSDGQLNYIVATLSGSTERSGSEVLVEWRSLEDPGDPVLLTGSRLTLLTVRFSQELPFIRLGETRWRFLLAVQNVLEEEGTTPVGGVSPLLDAESRLSGGVSVQF